LARKPGSTYLAARPAVWGCTGARRSGLPFSIPEFLPMNVFINDVPLIIKKLSEKVYKHKYDLVLEATDEFTSKDLVGDVLVRDATAAFLDRLLRLMEVKKLKKLDSLTLLVRKKKNLILHLKDQFKIAKAAGGLVVKDGQVLMIYRLGKWDLPKGKLNRDEDVALGAIREVEEECNIKVELGEELPSTWHSYAYKGNKMLKKTSWYVMKCLDDSVMRPQTEEYIEEVRWMSPQDALARIEESYASIALVVRHYLSEMAGKPIKTN
jgi:ADP-ribose pyrophosphatase YjhB (NUDIX family)